jgi:signal transduction histidine kinase
MNKAPVPMTGAAATDPERLLCDRILVLAPLGRDAAVLCRLLGENGLHCEACRDADGVAGGLRAGSGAVLLTEEALTPSAVDRLARALAAEPAWSDPPLLLLADGREADATWEVTALRASGNLTVLERPARALTLVTVVQAALRARRRQYEIRDLIDRERTARAEAEAANRVKDEFLANVTHELRTPLSAVLLWTRLLAGGKVPPGRQAKALGSIERSALAQFRLIEDLLDATRMASGGPRLDLRDCDPSAIVAAAADVVRSSASEKRVELLADPGPSPGAVRADPARLQQVVTNLLSNAVKFTPTGGRVTIGLDRAGDRVLIRVADTGAGIPPGFLPHVFERFRRGESTAFRREDGLGLGLAIARQLVEAHGGSISVESPGEGLGSTFTVGLPAAGPEVSWSEVEEVHADDQAASHRAAAGR